MKEGEYEINVSWEGWDDVQDRTQKPFTQLKEDVPGLAKQTSCIHPENDTCKFKPWIIVIHDVFFIMRRCNPSFEREYIRLLELCRSGIS